MKNRVLLLAAHSPIPTLHGGSLDVKGLKEVLEYMGHEVLTLSFNETGESYPHKEIFNNRRKSPITWRILFGLTPWQNSSRRLSREQIKIARDYRPDIVVCVQEYVLDALRRLKLEISWEKTVLRRANCEEEYLKAIRSNASLSYRVYLTLEILRLKVLLRKWSSEKVDEIWDISPKIYGLEKFQNILTGPFFPEFTSKNEIRSKESQRTVFTILHIGNLGIPHAQQGLIWFMREVWPDVISSNPDVKFVLAGRNPSRKVTSLAESSGVNLIPNPDNLLNIFQEASIFVNPVFEGSGVNMKLAEPAVLGIPIVSTTFGARGYEALGDAIDLADSANEFREQILKHKALWREGLEGKQRNSSSHELLYLSAQAESLKKQSKVFEISEEL